MLNLAHLPQSVPQRPSFTLVVSAGGQLPRVTPRQLILIRLGDPAAQEAFLHDWLPYVEIETRRYAHKGAPAEELQSEGNLALWEAVHQYDPTKHRTAPERYIHNQIHRKVRRAYREAMGFDRPLQPAADTGAPDHRFDTAERTADLAAAMKTLRPVERDQLTQYLRLTMQGLGPDEAARALAARQGGSFAAIKKRMERLRRKVREKVAP